jgi:hypothetical protein
MNYDRFYSHSTIFQLLVCCILWHSLQVGPTLFLYIKRARDSVNVCGWYIMEACFITVPVENHCQVMTYKLHTVSSTQNLLTLLEQEQLTISVHHQVLVGSTEVNNLNYYRSPSYVSGC